MYVTATGRGGQTCVTMQQAVHPASITGITAIIPDGICGDNNKDKFAALGNEVLGQTLPGVDEAFQVETDGNKTTEGSRGALSIVLGIVSVPLAGGPRKRVQLLNSFTEAGRWGLYTNLDRNHPPPPHAGPFTEKDDPSVPAWPGQDGEANESVTGGGTRQQVTVTSTIWPAVLPSMPTSPTIQSRRPTLGAEDEAQCRSYHGHLVEINSPSENYKIVALAQERNVNYVWIGLNDLASGQDFRWDGSNSRPSYTNWRSGEPNNLGGDEDCVRLDADSAAKWNDADCHAACDTVGGHLVEIQSADENAFVLNFFQTHAHDGDRMWIGLEDIAVEGEWVWSSNRDKAEYTNWSQGQPDSSQSWEDCVELSPYYGGRWNDIHCEDYKFPFTCQKR
ncbi:hypothetical protein BaRGS_00039312, partial [Batillaria attramentaria]